jgi:diguanylate cyclase (GGDEF)-like protein/PAS domain S-box-containing protein
MRRSLAVTTLGVCWSLGVIVVGFAVHEVQQHQRHALVSRFADRAETSTASISAYVNDVFERESRMADSLPQGRVTDTELSSARLTAGFATSVLIAQNGHILASSPPGPSLHGTSQSNAYHHIAAAMAGERAVSGVLSSAVGPNIEFALPIGDGRVLSSGFALGEGPLATFLALPPIEGVRGYVVDSSGKPVVLEGDGATESLEGTDADRLSDTPVVDDGRVMVSAPIDGTSWRLLITAPLDAVIAPTTAGDWIEWLVFGVGSIVLLAVLIVLRSVTVSRMRSREAQAESEQRFRLTVDNAPIGMIMVGLDARIIRSNARFGAMIGYDSEDLVGMSVHDITHPDDHATDELFLAQLFADDTGHYEREKRYVHHNGGSVWARVSVTLVRDARGKPLHFVGQSEDITEMRAAQEQLEHRALYDSLTGLANRGLLMDRLTHALAEHRREGEMIAVAFCDLDHFKRVNDSLGHHAGDIVLQEVARRLQSVLRHNDTLARVGGDEFVIMLPHVTSEQMAVTILDRAKQAVDAPIEVEGHRINMTFSAGVAIAEPDTSADAMLRHADRALYAAKEAGRARVTAYTNAMRSTAMSQLSLEEELRLAIERDEFELHYQPIVRLSDGESVAYEALLRWRHPKRGLLLPGAFLNVAQTSHLMVDLGRIVLQHVCEFLARHPHETWRVFLNVAPVQLGRGLSSAVQRELAAAGVSPHRLGMEITENGILVATGSSLAEMEELKAMGVMLLIDDFGTGYSALSSILTTPVTGIKLDRSFTSLLGRDPAADRISATMANLVLSLGDYAVVEGIETDEQRDRAVAHGWTYGQGYLFGHPLPEAELELPRQASTPAPVPSGTAHVSVPVPVTR